MDLNMVLGAVGAVIGVVGLVLTIHYARKAEQMNLMRKRLEWADLQAAANDLARRIKRDGAPAVMVAPGLRGATFANLLASEFVDQPPVYVGVSTWKEGSPVESRLGDSFVIDTKKWQVQIPNAVWKHEGTVLIVDDFVMSGDFLDSLKQELVIAGLSADRIRSAAVAATKISLKNHKAPDYYWWLAEDDEFFFPWGKAR